MKIKASVLAALVIAVALLAHSAVSTASSSQSNKTSDEALRAQHAADVLSEIMATPDQQIPEGLLKRAYGIAVIPHVVKGALGIGGRYGKGIVAERNAQGGWGTPLYISIGGGSFGLQLGVEATDVVMVFTNRDGVMPLLKGKLKIGADAGATAGPVGRNATAGTDIQLKSAIYSYSRSKGLFAGISLDGSLLELDDDANAKVYGKGMVAADIADHNASGASLGVVTPFLNALRKYAPAYSTTQQ